MSQDRPQDRPGEPEPTRLAGGRPPQDPPAAQPPQQPQEPWTPAGAPPAGQSPQGGGYGQPPQGGGYGQPPQGGGYGQPPQGGGYGQPPGGGYGQPPQGGGYGPGGPGYGGPGGYGPPPGGFGPGGPEGPGGPRKPQDKKPLLIAGAALLVLLVVGGLGLFFVLGGEDDGADTATDETSQEATDEATEGEAGEEPTEGESAEEPEADPDLPSFEADELYEMGPLCEQEVMRNASEYDPDDPRIAAFSSLPVEDEDDLEYSYQGAGYSESWGVDDARFEDTNVGMCMTGAPGEESTTCEGFNIDEEAVEYDYVSVDYTVTFVEAATGAVLGEGENIVTNASQCPDSEYALIYPEGAPQFAPLDYEEVDEVANDFVDDQQS